MSSNVSDQDLKAILEAYYAWKKLNKKLSQFASRTVNFPEAISESIASYCLGYNWHNKAKTKQSGDASTPDGKLVEIKATSNFNDDLTSFSPNTTFDILIFVRLDKENDILYIYDLNMSFSDFQRLSVNSTMSVLEQQQSKRRPRLSIIKQIITPTSLEPNCIIDLNDLSKRLGVSY